VPGYPGGTNVSGNHVRSQFQLDCFGEALRFFALADELELLGEPEWEAVRVAAAAIEHRWQHRDAGIWELDARQWTHSRLACAAGLRSIAKRPNAARERAAWLALADRVVASISSSCLQADGAWQRSPDDPRIDAALLLGGVRGATPTDDPRHLATIEAVRRELSREGYVYRFRRDATTPLGEAEGSFVIGNFWMSLATLGVGDHAAATHWYERGLAACGSTGLFSEEFDVEERQLRGNLPQAFVHALVIEAATELARAADGVVDGGGG
jgi:GH15 family glucan-1,4-alpha-glucosidase